MKYIFVLLVAALGFYFFKNELGFENQIQVQDYQSLLQKVESQPVSIDEVKLGANSLAEFLCNDSGFQKVSGKTTRSCLKKYADFKGLCEARVFDEAPSEFTKKERVTQISKRYAACVGAV